MVFRLCKLDVLFSLKEVRMLTNGYSISCSNELQDGRAVCGLMGGTRFDPGRFVPLIRAGRIETEECMQRMYVCRGFTAHQLSEQIHSV